MRIIVADTAGFCFGVKRAIGMALDAATRENVTSLGPLIHNPVEVERLSRLGILPAASMEGITTGTVIIRSHGLPPMKSVALKQRGYTVIDATCPIVKRAQRIAGELSKECSQVVIVGDRNHPEVIGILGYAGGDADVVGSLAEAEALAYQDKVGVLSQTTQSEELFHEIVATIRRRCREVVVRDTICNATKTRQKEVGALADQADLILVIGGRNSANTIKLATIARSHGAEAYIIENVDDLTKITFTGRLTVGITAGASTPNWIIEEVMAKMQALNENKVEGEKVMEEQNAEVKQTEEVENVVKEEVLGEAATETPSAAGEEAAKVADAGEATEAGNSAAIEEESPKEETMAESYAAFNKDFTVIRRGERLTGTIIKVSDSDIMVDIGGKSEGVIPKNELTPQEAENIMETFHEGDKVDVIVLRKENEDGHPVLSKKRVDMDIAWEKLAKAMESNETLEGGVLDIVKGGLLVDVGLKGFVPASLVELGYVNQLEAYRGKTIQFKVLECDKSHNKLILSRKAYLEEEKKRRFDAAWASIAEGQVRKGTVQRITNFGAFVDLDGVDGLLHVSQMAWYRVNHPSEILSIGDVIDVYVLNVDREHEKISLGLKQLIPNPWSTVPDKYPVGAIVEAKVVRTATFGAFVQLEPGVEGLVHISQLAYGRVGKTEDAVTPGDIVNVKVLGFDLDSKKISLSIKEALDQPEE